MSEIVNIGANRTDGVGVLVGSKMRNLDKQKRLTINANWRHAIGADADGQSRVYLAPGVTSDGRNCLDVIPDCVIRRRYAFLEDIPEDDPRRALMAVVFESIDHKTIDVQGRVGIPDYLLAYAEIVDNVMMTGAGDCIKVTAATDKTEEIKKVDFDAFRNARMELAKLRSGK